MLYKSSSSWFKKKKKKMGKKKKPVLVDESFPVSSGLLNLVIVLVNDVKQHRLGRERETSQQDEMITRKTCDRLSCLHLRQSL